MNHTSSLNETSSNLVKLVCMALMQFLISLHLFKLYMWVHLISSNKVALLDFTDVFDNLKDLVLGPLKAMISLDKRCPQTKTHDVFLGTI